MERVSVAMSEHNPHHQDPTNEHGAEPNNRHQHNQTTAHPTSGLGADQQGQQQRAGHLLNETNNDNNSQPFEHMLQDHLYQHRDQGTNPKQADCGQANFLHEQFRHYQQQLQQHHPPNANEYLSLNSQSTTHSLDFSTFGDLSPSCWSDSTLSNCEQQQQPGRRTCRREKTGSLSRPKFGASSRQQTSKSRPAADAKDDCDKSLDEEHEQALSEHGNPSNSSGGGGGMKRKRCMANQRERERTKSLNQALGILRDHLPVLEAEKKSKIQTLRTAKEYIEFLAIMKRASQQLETTAERDSSSQKLEQYHRSESTETKNQGSQHQQHQQHQHQQQQSQQPQQQHFHQNQRPVPAKITTISGNNFSNNISDQNQTNTTYPDSPLTYKFYKFRHLQNLRS